MRHLKLMARAVILSTGLVLMSATAASADSYTGHPGQAPPVAATQFAAPSVESGPVGQAVPASGVHLVPPSSGLAFTGADIAESVVIGAGALAVGSVCVRLSRRRRLA